VAELAVHIGETSAKRVRLQGHVQGVGFRPFVYRLAIQYGIVGHVQNQLGEVEVVAQGQLEAVERFIDGLITAAPPLSSPSILSVDTVSELDRDTFEIIGSVADTDAQIFVPPDYSCAMTASESCRIRRTGATHIHS
jgi:hydrogenase maturation protein HypF